MCLFPNKYQTDNLIRAKQPIQVPAPEADFEFTAVPPFGTGLLKAIATVEPLEGVQLQQLTQKAVTDLSEATAKDFDVNLKKKRDSDWADAEIEVATLPVDVPPAKPARLAVCVGISKFLHPGVPPLQVSHLDAERMAEALARQCQVDPIAVLTNSQATRQAIEQVIFHDLVEKSKPGDTVIIFFSTHGGRVSDVNGDEDDGLDEYLVPHDGVLGKPDTMILDDTFARWMQQLEGRKIAVILDNCYSGGSSKSFGPRKELFAKGLPGSGAKSASLDFFDGEMRRAKDLGQQGTIILAASQADQLAWEMPSADQGSVLTYHVLQSLTAKGCDVNNDGRLTFGEVFRFIEDPIKTYVLRTFQANQDPVLRDNANDGIFLKP